MKFLILLIFLMGCASLGDESRYFIMSGERFCECRGGVDFIEISKSLDRYASVSCRDKKSTIVIRQTTYIPNPDCVSKEE